MQQPPGQSTSSEESKGNFTEDRKLLETLADCILEDLKIDIPSDSDPFDHYAHQLKQRWYHHLENFPQQFWQGYEILRTVSLPSEKEDSSNDHPTS
jgi:hypothetical protein